MIVPGLQRKGNVVTSRDAAEAKEVFEQNGFPEISLEFLTKWLDALKRY